MAEAGCKLSSWKHNCWVDVRDTLVGRGVIVFLALVATGL